MTFRKVGIVAALVIAFVSLGYTTTLAATKTAMSGQRCTIVGTEKSDVLRGTSRADVICGLGGNDTIYGLAGADVIDGGSGNDRLYGGEGNDWIFGGSGTDLIDGGAGSNLCLRDTSVTTSGCKTVAKLPKVAAPAPVSTPSSTPTSSTSPEPSTSPSASPSASPSPSNPSPSNPSTSTPSQPTRSNITVTFDSATAETTLIGFLGDAPSLATSPSASPSGSTSSLRISRDGSAGYAGSVFYTASQNLITANSKVVTLELYAPSGGQAVLLKLEDPNNAANAIETLATTSASGWQTLSFNFASPRSGTSGFSASTSYRKAVIFYGFGSATGALTTYVDNVVFQPESTSSAHSTPTTYTRGALLWADEFNGSAGSIDSSKWTSRTCGHSASNGGGSCHNNEQQAYLANANALDGAGNAVITSTKTASPTTGAACLAWSGTCPFTSGRFDTQGKVSFQYGILEARVKNPVGGANWPAFWMLGTDITSVGWPSSGEIDIMEGKSSSQVAGAIHWSNGGNDAYAYANYSASSFTSDYHVYSVYWLENYIALYVDGTKILERTNTTLDQPGTWAFNHPFFVIFNNAISPAGGFSDAYNGWSSAQMKIDYVRYYQLNGVGSLGQ
jgi:beta-glucanase (GH16 family)